MLWNIFYRKYVKTNVFLQLLTRPIILFMFLLWFRADLWRSGTLSIVLQRFSLTGALAHAYSTVLWRTIPFHRMVKAAIKQRIQKYLTCLYRCFQLLHKSNCSTTKRTKWRNIRRTFHTIAQKADHEVINPWCTFASPKWLSHVMALVHTSAGMPALWSEAETVKIPLDYRLKLVFWHLLGYHSISVSWPFSSIDKSLIMSMKSVIGDKRAGPTQK